MSAAERSLHEAYWKTYAKEPSLESMLLDSDAKQIDAVERPEILNALGSVAGKKVLELGAGIGRLTSVLAIEATEVIACEFIEHLVDKNREINGDKDNIIFLHEDATKLDMQPDSLDVVFMNWLLLCLNDAEVETLIKKALIWLKEGGIFFFRESCYVPGGTTIRTENPSHYRSIARYFEILDCASYTDPKGKYFKLDLVRCANVRCYVELKKSYGQIYWKLTKTEKEPEQSEFRQFLDSVQYTNEGIRKYEKLFGYGFVSTGGVTTMDEVLKKVEWKQGTDVLDVGCGVGGGDFHIAKKFGVNVLGIDLSVNMIDMAIGRSVMGEYETEWKNVTFEVSDCTTREFPKESFDVVYSRDTILHIQDKPRLFKRMYEWLKPGGQILITDYCRAEGEASPGFAAYIEQRGYDLHSVQEYGKMLEAAGFAEVHAEDTTESMFLPSLQRELKLAESNKSEFLKEFTEEDYEKLIGEWKNKIDRANAGEQRWGLFFGKKLP